MLAAWGQQKTDISLPVWQERSAKENLRKSCRAECGKSIFAGILVLVCLGIFALMNACEIICVERECTRAKHGIFFYVAALAILQWARPIRNYAAREIPYTAMPLCMCRVDPMSGNPPNRTGFTMPLQHQQR